MICQSVKLRQKLQPTLKAETKMYATSLALALHFGKCLI